MQFHTLINIGLLGFSSYRLYLKFDNSTPKKEQEIINFLKNQKIVSWLISIDGEYDLGVAITTKTINEINELWKELLKKYRNFIQKRNLGLFTKVSYYPRKYLLKQKSNLVEYIFLTGFETLKYDKKDMKILKLISQNSRLSILEIARIVNLTPKTVGLRIKQLEKNNIIIGYRTVFNIEKLGYLHFKVHINLHNINELNEKMFRTYIKQNPYIIYDNEILGGNDIEIELEVQSLQDLRHILEDIKTKFPKMIRNYNYMLFYKEHKHLSFPLNI